MASEGKSKKKGDADGNESDGSVCSTSSSSSSTSGGAKKKSAKGHPVLTEGEYRTIKPLRPIQSKTLPRRASTGASMGSVEQQTIINMVPPGQVIKVDVSKSKEYSNMDDRREPGGGTLGPATGVMSSFKPTDSAKLYASPDDLKTIGYREGVEGNSASTGATGGTLKKVRSQSVPRKEADYAKPNDAWKNGNNSSSSSNLNSHEMMNGRGGEPEYEGINHTIKKLNTYNHVAPSSNEFDPQKSLQEAKDKLKPVKPALKSSIISGNNIGEPTKIRIEVKQSPRLVRKAEKTVTFQSESPPPPPTGATTTNGNAANNSAISHSMSVDEIQKVKTSLKSSKSFPNDLGADENGENTNATNGPAEQTPMMTAGGEFVTCLPVNPDSDSSEDSSDKTWILKDENGPSSSASDSVQTVISNPGIIPDGQKPGDKSLNDKSINSGNLSNNSNHVLMDATGGRTMSAVSQLGVTHHLQQKQLTYLQQQQQHQVNVYGTLGRAPRPALANNTVGPGGKGAVSLVKLPPPMETESEAEDNGRSSSNSKEGPRKPYSNAMQAQMYHTLQPQRSKSMLVDHHMQQQQHVQQQHQQLTPQQQQQQQLQHQYMMQQRVLQMQQQRQGEKSIEESLKLIHMHVAALKVS